MVTLIRISIFAFIFWNFVVPSHLWVLTQTVYEDFEDGADGLCDRSDAQSTLPTCQGNWRTKNNPPSDSYDLGNGCEYHRRSRVSVCYGSVGAEGILYLVPYLFSYHEKALWRTR